PTPGRGAGIGITSLLSDAPVDPRGQDRERGAYDRYGDYATSYRYNRGYNDAEVEGYYPGTHPTEPAGVMSISQLVGGDAGGGHEYTRDTAENATRPPTYGMRTPPSRTTQGAFGYAAEHSPDVPLAKQAEPIVVTDDDSALGHGHPDVADGADKAAAARAELVSDEEDRPLATQTDFGDMPEGGSGKPPAKRRRQTPKSGRRSRSSTKASLADHDAAEYTAPTPVQSTGRRRQPRRLRNGKKLELSRAYVYDEDDDDDDDEDIPLGQSIDNLGESRYPLDISGEQDVAVPGSHMMDGSGAHALPADDYSVDENVQAYVHHVKQRTDRAIAKYEERAKRKSQRMHEHVVQRYGPYLGDYFEKTGERPEYDEVFLDNGYHRVNYGELEDSHEGRGNGHAHARHRGYENGYADDMDYPLSGLARNSLRPPPMGYFPPSRPLSPAGYEFGYGRDDTPRSAGSEPLALLASEEAAAASRIDGYYEKGERGGRKSLWAFIATEQVPRAHRHMVANIQIRNANMRKVVQLCQREVRRVYGLAPTRTIQLNPQQPILVQRPPKELLMRSRRSMREMLMFWKRYEKEEREMRKRAEREAAERQKQEEEAREARRQARKLNFLITQTELYSHFVGSKISDAANAENGQEAADGAGTAAEFKSIDFDNADDAALTAHARQSAQNALAQQQAQARAFDGVRQIQQHAEKDASADVQDASVADALDTMDFQEPQTLGGPEIAQPRMLMCQLKEYQLKGLNWL
ncbi:putative DNA helicase ino80, partial [Coemansia guatemalensis]